jgi:hypothetical protein
LQSAFVTITVISERDMKVLQQRKYLIDIVLSVIAIGVIVFYTICATSCSYLKGSVLGIELQYIGIAYMAALVCLNIFKKDLFILLLLSAGLGVEAYLVGFQIIHAKYCPYCLVFGLIIVLQFLLNVNRTRKTLIASFVVIGFIVFAILFKGTAFPTYG